jgi:hypothetical protein
MRVRDELEAVIRGWHQYEVNRGAVAVIDFDFRPDVTEVEEITSRLQAYTRCQELLARAEAEDDEWVAGRALADLTYLGGLIGERRPVREYIRDTQGVDPVGWPAEYVTEVGERARAALANLGIDWGPNTADDLRELEGPLEIDEAVDEIRKAAGRLEERVRELTGATAPFNLTIETTDLDAYWSYWLDGAGSDVRMRINLRNAKFTKVGATKFALHEILGHGLQSASISENARQNDVPWVRLLSVHARQQVLLEGLAQTLPLFVLPEDELLVATVRLDHYTHLVRGELHIAINRGDAIEKCVTYAHDRAPFWTDEAVSNTLSDRSVNPQLRTYLWSYVAGIDWFVALADSRSSVSADVLRLAYTDPLTPKGLQELVAQ